MVGTAFQTASAGLTRQLKLLLRSGLNVNIKNDKGQNLLVAALMVQDPKRRNHMFRMLLRKGTNVFNVDPTTERDVLLWACVLNRHEEVKLVLQEGMSGLDLCKQDNGGYTGLHYVVMNGNRDTCKILCQSIVKIGLNVDVANNDGFTPYILAKRLGHSDCVEVLKREGRASTHQFDTSEFKMADSWSTEGQKEMEHIDKRLKAKKVIALKALGRMSQLHDANFKPSKVKVIASRHEKGLARVMYEGRSHRPWSAPNTKENKGLTYRDRLSKELQAIYEAKALTKSKSDIKINNRLLPSDREFSFYRPDVPQIRIQVNDVDLCTARQNLPPLQPVMRYTKSMPNLPTKDTDCDSPRHDAKSPSRSPSRSPSIRKEHWYPPSSSEIWRKRKVEKIIDSQIKIVEKVPPSKKPGPVVNISKLLGVMAEQRAAGIQKPKERIKLLPIDKDVANFIKIRKEAAASSNKRSVTVSKLARRSLRLSEDQKDGGSLAIIREDMGE